MTTIKKVKHKSVRRLRMAKTFFSLVTALAILPFYNWLSGDGESKYTDSAPGQPLQMISDLFTVNNVHADAGGSGGGGCNWQGADGVYDNMYDAQISYDATGTGCSATQVDQGSTQSHPPAPSPGQPGHGQGVEPGCSSW